MNECEVDGVRYVAREAEDCDGCAGDSLASLCSVLPHCQRSKRADGRTVAWVRADGTEPIGFVVWLPGRTPDRALVIDRARAEQMAAEHHTTFQPLRTT